MKFLLYMLLVLVLFACTTVTVAMLAYPEGTWRQDLHWYAALYVTLIGSWAASVAMREAR